MPRRRRMDQQNVESAGNEQSPGRNTHRRLSPSTAAGNMRDIRYITHSANDHSSHNDFSGIQISAPLDFPPEHNVTGGFQNSSTSGTYESSTPPGTPASNTVNEHETITNLAILGSQRQSIYNLLHLVRSRLGFRVRSPRDPRLRFLMVREARVNYFAPPFPPVSHPLVAAQWRENLVRHGFELLRSIGVAALQYQVDEGNLEEREDDMHEQMRLDVHDMSYEELLSLVEDIGKVENGLSEEDILARVGRYGYQSLNLGSQVEEERCCICQEDYIEGEELGKLECGHEFHFSCIKQWLMQKNACPLCRKAV